MIERFPAIIWRIACAALLVAGCMSAGAESRNGAVDRPVARTSRVTTSPTSSVAGAQPTTDKALKPRKNAQALANVEADAPAAFLAEAMPGRPTDHSVTMNLLPAQTLEAYIEYGTVAGAYSSRTPAVTIEGGQPFEILLDNLPANTRSYYRVRYRTTGAAEFAAGEERSFTTQRAPGTAFTFDVQGDSHPERAGKQFDADLYVRALSGAAADQPDFYFTIGDDFSVDTLKVVNSDTVAQLYENQRKWLGLVGAPVFLVNGNHEQAALANLDGTPDNVAVWAQKARNAYYPQPAPDGFYTGDTEPVQYAGLLRDYYAFTWGDALFVVIDPYWHSPEAVDNAFGEDRDEKRQRDLWNVTLGEAQYQWFKKTLQSSTARFKFVFAHHVNGTGRGGTELAYTFEWGNLEQFPTRRPGWSTPIHQLMAQNDVTIFFQGHDHIFARQELDGVIYQTLPEPANPFYSFENVDAFKSGDKLPNSGHLRVTVAPEQVTVDYVRAFLPSGETDGHANGEVAFSYAIPAKVQPPGGDIQTLLPLVSAAATLTDTHVARVAFPGNIVLGRPADRSVTASLLADAPLEAYLEYGSAPGVYGSQTAVTRLPAGEPVPLLITSLQPDAAYTYRVRFREVGNTAFAADAGHSFHTQRSPGSAFTFTLDADPHNRDANFDADVYGVTMRGIVADKPDFHINLGDTFMTEKLAPTSYEQVVGTYREMRSFFGLLGGSAPLFLVNGNHDGELGWQLGGTPDNLAVWALQARHAFYPNPTPGGFYTGSTVAEPLTGVRDGYYAWTWGDALFIVLDPYWYSLKKPRPGAGNWDITLGDAQYLWLRRTLATSNATFKFVFAHNLAGGADQNMRGGIEAADKWEWGGRNADGSWGFAEHRPDWSAPIHQLLVESDVTIFFHGHDHLFVKQELDGVVYQECPQPSYSMYDRTGSAAEYGYTHGEVLGGSGYLRVKVAPGQVTVDYVRSYLPADENAQRKSGQVSYSYTVTAP